MYAKISRATGTSTKSAATKLKILNEPPLYSLLGKQKFIYLSVLSALFCVRRCEKSDSTRTRPNFPYTNLSDPFRYSLGGSRTVDVRFRLTLSSSLSPWLSSQVPAHREITVSYVFGVRPSSRSYLARLASVEQADDDASADPVPARDLARAKSSSSRRHVRELQHVTSDNSASHDDVQRALRNSQHARTLERVLRLFVSRPHASACDSIRSLPRSRI